jgi:DNA-binding response OmpR family regulator
MAGRHPTSVRADSHAIVAALQAGADDNVTRSFTVRESTARPSVLGRRVGSAGGPEDEEAQEMEFDHDRPAPLVARERRGTVHVSGPLTVRGADLLQGTVESLHRSGHDRVLLDLQGVQVGDDAGRHVLRDLGRELRASGGELLLHGWWALVQSLALRNQWALWGNRVP